MSNYHTECLDHLGIITGICKEIDLIQNIDRLVPQGNRKVSVGESVQAMILNALGFSSRALYLTPEFFNNRPVETLIKPGLLPEDFNDDSLGRALDALFNAGVTEVFAGVASSALEYHKIDHQFVHLDTSSFHLHGEYDRSRKIGEITVNRGLSKDHRPDLKQVVVSLICSYRSSIPVWFQALNGNNCDKTSFPKTIRAFASQMKDEDNPYYVADSALYTKKNIIEISKNYWITRVPETIKEARESILATNKKEMEKSSFEGYYYREHESNYGDISQRWLIVFSEKAYQREEKTFQKNLGKEKEKAEKELWHLSNKEFASESEAQAAVISSEKKYKHHLFEVQFQPQKHFSGKGRPSKNASPKKITWKIVGQVKKDESAIKKSLAAKGFFIIATNQMDKSKLSNKDLLAVYKVQGSSVERGFRFLKDPQFFADSLFLKNPNRIMALLMVMTLALLVYSLAERKIRTQFEKMELTIPDQKGKPTSRPTIRRIFQMFEGIHVLEIEPGKKIVTNLTEPQKIVIRAFGPEVRKCYFLDP